MRIQVTSHSYLIHDYTQYSSAHSAFRTGKRVRTYTSSCKYCCSFFFSVTSFLLSVEGYAFLVNKISSIIYRSKNFYQRMEGNNNCDEEKLVNTTEAQNIHSNKN